MGTLFHTRKSNFPKTGSKFLTPNTPPPKNYKKFPRYHVKRWTILYKKMPRPCEPGQKMATETIKEKQ
jgi:hypothetical protein